MWGHWYPCFGLMVTSPLSFKARDGSLIHTWQRHMCCMFTGIHLWWDTYWLLGSQNGSWINLFHIPVSRYWWAQNQDLWTSDKCSTNWAMLAWPTLCHFHWLHAFWNLWIFLSCYKISKYRKTSPYISKRIPLRHHVLGRVMFPYKDDFKVMSKFLWQEWDMT